MVRMPLAIAKEIHMLPRVGMHIQIKAGCIPADKRERQAIPCKRIGRHGLDHEEGKMGPKELQRLAKALGIPSADQSSIGVLIHAIRFEEGLMPCFSAAWSAPCGLDECPTSVACSSRAFAGAAI